MQAGSAQLDLFLDSQAVVLANEVGERLLARDAAGAESALYALEREGSDHPGLAGLRILVQFACDWQPPAKHFAKIARSVARLEQQVAPAASLALGNRGTALVQSYYRDLAAAAVGAPYDPEHLSVHAACLWARCGEFAASEQAALSIPGWQETPDALHWCSVARCALTGLAAARPTLFALAWRAPGRLDRLVAELADAALGRDWHVFESCDWPATPHAELGAWFPAWYVMQHPAASADIALAGSHSSPAGSAAELLVRILDRERDGNSRELLHLRKRLRDLSSDLFSLYMAHRSVFHR